MVTISSTPAGVSGTLTVNALNGVATFSSLVFSATGTYSLSAASSGLTGATSATFVTVILGPSFAISGNSVMVAPGATTVTVTGTSRTTTASGTFTLTVQ
ncbi:MAG: hypothetical protein ABSA42_16885 [Terracidiphilus sp.]